MPRLSADAETPDQHQNQVGLELRGRARGNCETGCYDGLTCQERWLSCAGELHVQAAYGLCCMRLKRQDGRRLELELPEPFACAPAPCRWRADAKELSMARYRAGVESLSIPGGICAGRESHNPSAHALEIHLLSWSRDWSDVWEGVLQAASRTDVRWFETTRHIQRHFRPKTERLEERGAGEM